MAADLPVILAIDPGPVRSAFIAWNRHSGGVRNAGIVANIDLLLNLRGGISPDVSTAVIEKVESFGMPVGAEVFETVYWSGQFAEALARCGHGPERIGRKAVKISLCGSAKAKDPNVRQALIDRFGGPSAIRKGGPLYGIHGDLWAALAVAVAWSDLHGGER